MTLPSAIFQLAARLGERLNHVGKTVATAESCTGGGVAQAITAVPGSSSWFEYAAVTYSDRMKRRALGVSYELLSAHGAVSEPVVEAMVAGLLEASSADIGVAISGIAGPGGNVPGKPVGTVCFGWGAAGDIETTTRYFSGDRAQIREQAVVFALTQLIEQLNRQDQ